VKKANAKYFGLDDPDDNKDEFGRNDFATEIAKYICDSFGKRSLAVGISGSWGTGKSHLLHQIQKTLNAQNNRSILVIKFNPWRSSTHNRIVEDFLQNIKAALSVYDKSLSDKLEKYLKVLIETDKTNWTKTIAETLSISENKSSEQLYNEINDCLQLIHKKLVIFIDDLDRLHNEEIIEVFRIVRNTADFFNTCFVVAYDREYVMDSFPSSNLQLRNYLDKIFQTEFVLPLIDPGSLVNVIIDEVFNHFHDNSIVNQELKKIFSNSKKRELVLDLILNRRDAIRFANMLSFDIKSIQNNIDYGEFIFVILLKMKFPAVYNILNFRDNRNALLEAKHEDSKSYYKMYTSGYKDLKEKNPKIFESLSTTSIEIVGKIFGELFEQGTDFSIKSIRHIENYYRYFSLTISSNDISNEEFWDVISKPFSEAIKEIDKWYGIKSKGSLDIHFLNYNISEFEEIYQIKNYIYGIKKACIKVNLQEAVTKFHIALNNGGFYNENFKALFPNSTLENLDNQIVDLIMPEGAMDGFNWIVIEELYKEGKDGNNLYSKEKSKELVIDRFIQLQKTETFNLLFDSWKTLVSGKDFDKWDEDIFKLTNDFADQILKNKDKIKEVISFFILKEKTLEKSESNSAILVNDTYRKEHNILKDFAEILANKFLHLVNLNQNEILNEKTKRISFSRELMINCQLSANNMIYLINFLGPDIESCINYEEYRSKILDIYPVNKDEFEQFDIELFSYLQGRFKLKKEIINVKK